MRWFLSFRQPPDANADLAHAGRIFISLLRNHGNTINEKHLSAADVFKWAELIAEGKVSPPENAFSPPPIAAIAEARGQTQATQSDTEIQLTQQLNDHESGVAPISDDQRHQHRHQQRHHHKTGTEGVKKKRTFTYENPTSSVIRQASVLPQIKLELTVRLSLHAMYSLDTVPA